MNTKHIIREVPAEDRDFSLFFDDDGLTEAGGDYCYNLFIVSSDRCGRINGFNIKEYKNVQSRADEIINAFENVIGRHSDYAYWTYASYKEAMESFGIPYNSRKCHALKEWAKDANTDSTDDIAAFLTITTGKTWETTAVCGYCQGDYVELVYCPEHYENVEIYGEIWLGCGKEFYTIDLNDDGSEGLTCGGYIIADRQARTDADYKRLVCDFAGIDESRTTLEMIDDCYTTKHYTYRTA